MSKLNNYYTGTSGLLLPVPNKEFYPDAYKDKSRLNYYGSLFDSIEINSSFYKMPMQSTVQKWTADVPDDFRFTFKLSKEITHCKNLFFDELLMAQFFQRIAPAEGKSGCILVQFPSSIKPAYKPELLRLMSLIAANNFAGWQICVEFRHDSWYNEETYDLLRSHEIGLVLHDKLYEKGLFLDSLSNVKYVRFHGPDGNYRGSYSDEFLREYAYLVREWLDEGNTVYCYFNNTMGSAIANLNALKDFIF